MENKKYLKKIIYSYESLKLVDRPFKKQNANFQERISQA